MKQQIGDLVAMGDVQTLFDLMVEDDDWMTQLDAAEGLLKLRDRRGLNFLRSTLLSEDADARSMAREILDDPALEAQRAELDADEKRALQARKQAAVKRMQAGRKVFEYQMVFVPAGELLGEDPLSEGYGLPLLSEFGMQGWEVVTVVAHRRHDMPGRSSALGTSLLDGTQENMSGAYFLLKRELGPDDVKEFLED